MRGSSTAALVLVLGTALASSAGRTSTPAPAGRSAVAWDTDGDMACYGVPGSCGYTRPWPSAAAASEGAPATVGGGDTDITTPDGVYPSVTQSETQTWVQGTTIVSAYND